MIDRRQRAGAVVLRGDDVLLMGQNATEGEAHRWYHFPGGGIEPDEDAEAAAVRELHEETGLAGHVTGELVRVVTGAYEHRYFVIECDDHTLGECTGPEVDEVDASLEFAAEWHPVADLDGLAVWPRATAEAVAAYAVDRRLPPEGEVPEIEDYRTAWEGTAFTGPAAFRQRACLVIVDGARLAVMRRWRPEVGHYATLPGGGIEPGETVADAAAREALEELGVTVSVGARLAVVAVPAARALQTYVWCEVTGGAFGSGRGEEFTAERRAARGTYTPDWVPLAEVVDVDLRPGWLVDLLPGWIANPAPARPDRFTELPD